MKIYMAGVGGMLGEALYEEFRKTHQLKCSDKDVNADWLDYLNFTNIDDYFAKVRNFNPDILFHIGAITNMEYCEANPNEAYLTNTTGTENAVLIANELKIPVLYISTAGIFDGNQPAYDDWDTPNPISVYGRTKYLGEKYVVENARYGYYVLRPGWMMGGYDKDKKFVKKIVDQLKKGTKTIFAVWDKLGSPTYTIDFAKCLRELISLELYGVYNMCGEAQVSRSIVADKIVKFMGSDAEVISVHSSHFPEYNAPRPPAEVLINTKLRLRNLNNMRIWTDALKHYLRGYGQL